jgi:cyclopropane-fatty-acyl-phospholipid synthase
VGQEATEQDMQASVGHPTRITSSGGRLSAANRAVASFLGKALEKGRIALVLWDGTEVAGSSGSARYRIFIRSPKTLVRLLTHPQLYFGESYAEGAIEIDGHLPDVMTALYQATGRPHGLHFALDRAKAHLQRIRPARSLDNVHHHYDIGNDFYRLWLDERMVYTCAYFPTADATLEQAQLAKLDHVCRKLRLRPGERVIEAGCGWGALALHMARNYGARVRAFNLSSEQIEFARAAAKRDGLTDRVEFVHDDYRSASGRCDAFVSVGMLEHVGLRCYRELGQLIRRVLEPEGRGFIHSIGRPRPAPTNSWIQRRIFPDGYTPSLGEMMEIFEPNDLAVVDVENLRLHYAKTLEHWLARYERALPKVREMFDETFVRTWRLYLAGSIAAFRVGSMQLYQVLFASASSTSLPMTRADIYGEAGA